MEDRPFEYLIYAYISHKYQNKYKGGVYEYNMGLTMFRYYINRYGNGNLDNNAHFFKVKEKPTLENIALICCKHSMGMLFRFVIEYYDLKLKVSKQQWCSDYAMESGDIKTIEWLNEKYGLIPSEDSMNEVFLSGVYELTR